MGAAEAEALLPVVFNIVDAVSVEDTSTDAVVDDSNTLDDTVCASETVA